MAEHSKESSRDKYDDIFEAVLSSRESESYMSPVHRNEPTKAANVNLKKRQLSLRQENLNTTGRAKKRRETTRDRILKWNKFYSNEEFGIWIECTECKKWRKVMEYEEDHEVPTDWCCSMSLSGIKGCDDPENIEAGYFSPVEFVPGTIVWAKLEGYPWWPGMVEDDPDTEEYYWIENNGTCYYNVTFLDDKVSHAWVPASFVCSYLKPFPPKKHSKEKYKTSKYSNLIETAKKKAEEAITMSIKERLKLFSFACRYEGKWSPAVKLDDGNDDEDAEDVTEILIKEIEDIESVRSTDSDYRSDSSSEQKKNIKNIKDDNSNCVKHKMNLNKIDSKKCSNTEAEIMKNDDNNITSNQSNNDKDPLKALKRFINTADNTNPSITDTKAIKGAFTIPLQNIKSTQVKLDERNILQNESNEIVDEPHIKIKNKVDKIPILYKKKIKKYVNSEEKKDLVKIANIIPTCNLEGKKMTQKAKSNDTEAMKKEISDKLLQKKFKPPLKLKGKDNKRNEIDTLHKNEIVSNGTCPLNSEAIIKDKKKFMNKEFYKTNLDNSYSNMDASFKEESKQSQNKEPVLNNRKVPDKVKVRNDRNKNNILKCNANTKQNEGNSSLNINQNKMDLMETERILNNKENEATVQMGSTKCHKTEVKDKKNEECKKIKIENTKTKQVLKILEKNCVGKFEQNSETETISIADSNGNTPAIFSAKMNNECEDKQITINNLGGNAVNSKAVNKNLNYNTKRAIKFPKKKVNKKVKEIHPSNENNENIDRKQANVTDTNTLSSTFLKKNVNKKVEEANPSTEDLYDSPPNNLKSQTENKNVSKQEACITKISTKNKLAKLIYKEEKNENDAHQLQIKQYKTKKENNLTSISDTLQNKTENSQATEIITLFDDESSSQNHNDEQEKHISMSFNISMQQSEDEDSDPFEAE